LYCYRAVHIDSASAGERGGHPVDDITVNHIVLAVVVELDTGLGPVVNLIARNEIVAGCARANVANG
jgi:hypothetical protein